jgi:carbamate kinase
MRIVIALGGNALLRRGEEMTADNQRENIRIAARALAPSRTTLITVSGLQRS